MIYTSQCFVFIDESNDVVFQSNQLFGSFLELRQVLVQLHKLSILSLRHFSQLHVLQVLTIQLRQNLFLYLLQKLQNLPN